jgi:hypothetical protein
MKFKSLTFTLNKNSRLNTWSQLNDITVINKLVLDNSNHLNKALQELNSTENLLSSLHFQFLMAHLDMLLTPPKNI